MPARKKLVAKIQRQEDGDSDVSGQEVGDIPMTRDEIDEAADEHEDKQYRTTEIGHVWLKSGAVWQICNALGKGGFAEVKVDDTDGDPAYISAAVDEIGKPVENRRTRVRGVEICEQADAGACCGSHIGDTRFCAACENFRCVTDQCHRIECTACEKEKRVA